MIQDSSFVVDVPSGDEGTLDVLAEIQNDRKPEKVSSVTVFELYEGIGGSTVRTTRR